MLRASEPRGFSLLVQADHAVVLGSQLFDDAAAGGRSGGAPSVTPDSCAVVRRQAQASVGLVNVFFSLDDGSISSAGRGVGGSYGGMDGNSMSTRSLDNVFTSRWSSVAVDSHAPAAVLARLWQDAGARDEAIAGLAAAAAQSPVSPMGVTPTPLGPMSPDYYSSSGQPGVPQWSVDQVEVQFSFEPVFQQLTPRNVPALQQAYVSILAWTGGGGESSSTGPASTSGAATPGRFGSISGERDVSSRRARGIGADQAEGGSSSPTTPGGADAGGNQLPLVRLRRFPSALDRLRRRPVDLLKAVLDGVGGSASRTVEDLVRRVLGMDKGAASRAGAGRRGGAVSARDGPRELGEDSSASLSRQLLDGVARVMLVLRALLEAADGAACVPLVVHPDVLRGEHERLLPPAAGVGASTGAGAGDDQRRGEVPGAGYSQGQGPGQGRSQQGAEDRRGWLGEEGRSVTQPVRLQPIRPIRPPVLDTGDVPGGSAGRVRDGSASVGPMDRFGGSSGAVGGGMGSSEHAGFGGLASRDAPVERGGSGSGSAEARGRPTEAEGRGGERGGFGVGAGDRRWG